MLWGRMEIDIELAADAVEQEQSFEADGVLQDIKDKVAASQGAAVVLNDKEIISDIGFQEEGECFLKLRYADGENGIHSYWFYSRQRWENYSKFRLIRPFYHYIPLLFNFRINFGNLFDGFLPRNNKWKI